MPNTLESINSIEGETKFPQEAAITTFNILSMPENLGENYNG